MRGERILKPKNLGRALGVFRTPDPLVRRHENKSGGLATAFAVAWPRSGAMARVL